MRQAVFAAAVLCTLTFPAHAQQSWTTEALEGGTDPFGSLLIHPDGLSFGFENMPAQPQAPLVYGGCLIEDDGLTPIICADGDGIKPPPDGFLWKDDPDASLSEPQHCLWWEEGETFVGLPGRWLCRDGAAPSGGRPPEALPRPGQADESESLPLSDPSDKSIF